ncbi:MAG: hypothetical protein L6R28_07810 [Planctomycetes bacterium]|nr:hypothetical protein [Planctomycetota bacterium]
MANVRTALLRRLAPVLLLTALLALPLHAETVAATPAADAPAAAQVVESYGSAPKGAALEGTAIGLEKIESVIYDKEKNEFTLNGKSVLANPVDRKEFVRILDALEESDLLAISLLTDKSTLSYGKLSKSSTTMKNLLDTDVFVTGVLWGKEEDYKGKKLPGDYQPQKVKERKTNLVAFIQFRDFQWEKKEGEAYTFAGANMIVRMWPLSDKKAPDGGFLPDIQKANDYKPEPEDQANLDHINTNRNEYFRIEPIATTLKYGMAAAIARSFRDVKEQVNLDELRKAMK